MYVLREMNMYELKPGVEVENWLKTLETKRRRMEDLIHRVSYEIFANLIQMLVDGIYLDVIRPIESFARDKCHAPLVENTVSAIRSEIIVNKYMQKREQELDKEEKAQPSIHMVVRSGQGSKKSKQFSKNDKRFAEAIRRRRKKRRN
ncbi:hypothetical protein PsorP6_012653 [Peronosclerospora sorghi]|uniref:Uncharacterized protein n=1 Tax=Peronosclerospora sorghi TaxID=230839 RepID=A0ACC0WFN3_9STRA|nr:hypothetical protein PsorP6_012653 [Peronosclerospora sorghi]